ncbi:hypothetical protein [Gorillibacterium sp. sgz5001074]|uniref:hypothetical protein n=1 Tax=Gorillibacterium sp. sgz5001074 TaxID=3446695 RepID=UPI003F6680C6
MGKSPFWRMAAVSLGLAVTVAVIGGCSLAEPSASANAVSPAPAAPSGVEPQPDSDSIQMKKEADMVRIFRFLIRLDEAPDTKLTKKQAEAMLPIVSKSVSEGILEEQEKVVLTKLFRPEQLAAYVRYSEKDGASVPPKWPQPDGRDGAGEEKHRRMEEWVKRAVQETPESEAAGIHMGWQASGRNPDEDWTAGEKSVEQELIELLESKLVP